MKRVLTLLLVFVLVLAVLVACNNDNNGDNSDNNPPSGGTTDDGGTNDGGTNGDGQGSQADEDLQAAYDYIKLTYKSLSATPNSFEVMKSAPIGEKIFAITWSTDNAAITITESEDGDFYVVNIPELGDDAISYALKFAIQNDKGEKKEGSFNLTVPAFSVNTFDEYVAAEDGELLIVEGVVTGVISKSVNSTKENSLFLQDLNGNGGYYAYNLAEDPAGTISVGMTVRVVGNKKNYNGTFELVNPVATVVDSTIKTVTPVDFTEVLASASSLSAPELVNKNGMLVKISGVTLLEYLESNGYHYFKLGDHKTYLRVSSSSNCITQNEGKALTESFQENFYNAADVVGIIAVYNGDFYLMPVSATPFTNFVEQDKPADVKVDLAMGNTTIPGIIQVAGDKELPTTFAGFSDVTISWELVENVACATLDGSKLTVTIPDTAQTVKLRATFAIGEVSKTKEYSVTVKGIDTITIKEADDMVAGFVKNQYTEEIFYVIGTITQISNDVYGNMYIVATIDGSEYGIDIYGMNDENGKKYSEFTGYKPQVGDTVKVRTVVGKYNNAQLKNAVLVEYNHNYDAGVITPPTCAADGYTTYTCACGHSYTDNIVPKGEHYYGEGVTDTTDKVCTGCGVKNHTHTTVAGDVVPPTCTSDGYTVYTCSDAACAFTENKDVQGKLDHNDTDGDFLCDGDGCDEIAVPAAGSTLTVEQAIKLGKLFASNTYTAGKYYVTGTIQEVYNSQYGNMYLTDGTNKLTVYGTYSADGAIRFDGLTVKPEAGNVITVYGIIGAYGTTPQMKNGWIQHSNTSVVTPPTCTEGGYTTYTCTFCGAVSTGDETDALDHNFVGGVCDRPGCGALDHEHNYTPVVTPPTCTEAGYTTYTCACTDTYKADEVPALNHLDENADYKCDRDGCNGLVLPAEGTVLTVAEALKIGELFKNDSGASYAPYKYYIVGQITALTSTKYGTCEITDATGTIAVYGLKDSTGNNRYEFLDVKPVVGDTVKIYGELGAYRQSIQFNNSNIIEHTLHQHEFVNGECICGEKDPNYVPPHEHEFVNGECSCGEKDPNYVAPPANSQEAELTVDSLGVGSQSYAAGTATVGGVGFEFVQIGNYGDGLQMRDKNGNTSKLWNTTAFGSGIVRIELVYSSTKDVQYANADAVIFTFGNAMGEATYTVKLSTEAGVKTYTITPDAATYTFFGLEHDLGYTLYWDSITVVYADGSSTPVEPPHEHEFVNGECSCGEKDPNYVAPPAAEQNAALTVDSLGVGSQSYAAGTATVGGVGFEFVQIGNYGDGLQMRDKNGNTSKLWNTTAFGSGIVRIELVYSSTKDVQYANADAVIFTFGNAVGEATYTVKLSTEAGVKTYTITPDAATYTFFGLEHDLGYTMYWDSITVVYADGSSTPIEPPHEHEFVNGECACGEKDPNYVPPHEHEFVNGECSCGEKDPNYVAPPAAEQNAALTVDSLGVGSQSYAAGTATVGGVGFEFVQIGNYGDGLQMRDKNGNTSKLWNTTAFGSGIVRIELVYSSTKDVTYANADAVIFTFGNAVGEATYTVKLSTEAGVKTYTITPDAATYTFFGLEHDLGYTMYWESITVVYADGSSTPIEPPHEHEFVNGECACGEKDPNYVPPHEHEFVNGECSCGEKDPNYVAPDEKTEMSVSKSHTDIAGIAGVTTGQNVGVIADQNIALNEDITIVCAKGTSTSDPCIYSESIRLYQNGATVTVKAAEGCKMTTIVIHLASKSGGQGPITVTGGTASELSDYTYTVTVDDGVSEVVITTAGTDKNNRLYVDNITVNYEK